MNPESNPRPEFTEKPAFLKLAAEQKKRELPMLIELLIFYIVNLVSSIASGVVLAVPMIVWALSGDRLSSLLAVGQDPAALSEAYLALLGQMPDWMYLLVLAGGILLGVGAIVYCRCIEKRSLRSMGLTGPHGLKSGLFGALLGVVSAAAVFGLTAAFGGVQLRGMRPLSEIWPALLYMPAVFLLQSAGEELLVHGYLMASLSKRHRLSVCILVSSVVFGLLHVAQPGQQFVSFLNAALLGAVLALLVLLSGNLWSAFGYHACWSLMQHTVLGLPLRGLEAGDSLLAVETIGSSPLVTGGAYGLEGSLSATLLLLAELGILIWLLSRRAPAEAAA